MASGAAPGYTRGNAEPAPVAPSTPPLGKGGAKRALRQARPGAKKPALGEGRSRRAAARVASWRIREGAMGRRQHTAKAARQRPAGGVSRPAKRARGVSRDERHGEIARSAGAIEGKTRGAAKKVGTVPMSPEPASSNPRGQDSEKGASLRARVRGSRGLGVKDLKGRSDEEVTGSDSEEGNEAWEDWDGEAEEESETGSEDGSAAGSEDDETGDESDEGSKGRSSEEEGEEEDGADPQAGGQAHAVAGAESRDSVGHSGAFSSVNDAGLARLETCAKWAVTEMARTSDEVARWAKEVSPGISAEEAERIASESLKKMEILLDAAFQKLELKAKDFIKQEKERRRMSA